jgi:hypothetical protein
VPGQEGPSLPLLDQDTLDEPDEEKSKAVAEDFETDDGGVDTGNVRNGSHDGRVARQLTVEESRQEAAKRMSKYSNPKP